MVSNYYLINIMQLQKVEKMLLKQYRVSKEDDKLIEKNAHKYGGESATIRALIRKYLK